MAERIVSGSRRAARPPRGEGLAPAACEGRMRSKRPANDTYHYVDVPVPSIWRASAGTATLAPTVAISTSRIATGPGQRCVPGR